jgi:hypothetical protein
MPKNYIENMIKVDSFRGELANLNALVDRLLDKAKQITPFTLRRQRLNAPYNKCRCLIPYKKTQVIYKNKEP